MEEEGRADSVGEVRGGNVAKRGGRRRTKCVEGGVGRGGRLAKCHHACSDAVDRAEVWMTGAPVADGLIAYAIFLLAEGEADERRGEKLRRGTRQGVQGSGANPQPHITQAKKRAIGGVARGAQVFARLEQEVKAKDQAIGRRLSSCCGRFYLSLCPNAGHHGER